MIEKELFLKLFCDTLYLRRAILDRLSKYDLNILRPEDTINTTNLHSLFLHK